MSTAREGISWLSLIQLSLWSVRCMIELMVNLTLQQNNFLNLHFWNIKLTASNASMEITRPFATANSKHLIYFIVDAIKT